MSQVAIVALTVEEALMFPFAALYWAMLLAMPIILFLLWRRVGDLVREVRQLREQLQR
jgi:hypothetical protein